MKLRWKIVFMVLLSLMAIQTMLTDYIKQFTPRTPEDWAWFDNAVAIVCSIAYIFTRRNKKDVIYTQAIFLFTGLFSLADIGITYGWWGNGVYSKTTKYIIAAIIYILYLEIKKAYQNYKLIKNPNH